MGVLFSGSDKSRDVRDIIQRLTEGSSALCNSRVAGYKMSGTDVINMSDEIRSAMNEHYSRHFTDSRVEAMLQEDADQAASMIMNNIADYSNMEVSMMQENGTVLPNLVTLTASIATTIRHPYEASYHRLYDTQVIDKQIIEIENVIPTIKAPGHDEEDLIDALAPYAPVPFITKTEIEIPVLTSGIVPGSTSNGTQLLPAMDPLYSVNGDVRITHIDATYDGTIAIPADQLKLSRGSVPYFDAKTRDLSCNFEYPDQVDPSITHRLNVTAKINFDTNVMEYVMADTNVSRVYFYGTVSHQEHTHPIKTAFRNYMKQYVVPTRPHIEVSIPQEMRTDISHSIQHLANVDVVTAMTENITVISSRMEDQRLAEGLKAGRSYEANFNFESPDKFAHGNLEWIKREFIPFLDQATLQLKNDWNVTDCHFRIAVSPYILRIIDTEYTMDKSLTEESKGSGVINYSIGVKTSTSTFYFISSQYQTNSECKVLLIPNNFKNSPVKTWNYFKYSSFLTDQLRRSDNATQPALVYSERNNVVVFDPIATDLTIASLPIDMTTGPYWIKRADNGVFPYPNP